MRLIEYKNIEGEFKDVDKKGRIMIGAFTAYNNLDADGDIGRKGMFNKTWKENFSRIKHLLNHDSTKPIGKPVELWEDDNFAYYKSQVGTHKLGDDVLDMAESGLLTEHSYGYQRIRENKVKEGNELLEVKQWEFTNLTGWGANANTPLLSFTKDLSKDDQIKKYIKRIETLEKFCRNSVASDETIELLLIECKQLSQLIIDLTTTPLIESTLPEDKSTTPDENSTLADEKTDDELHIKLALEAIKLKMAS